MPGIVMAITLGIAAGLFIVSTLKLTFETLFEKIKSKFAADIAKTVVGKLKGLFHKKSKVKKVLVAFLGECIKNCDNPSSLEEMNKLLKDNNTHIIAGVDKNNEIIDMDIIKDELRGSDNKVYDFINKSGEGMVVVSD